MAIICIYNREQGNNQFFCKECYSDIDLCGEVEIISENGLVIGFKCCECGMEIYFEK